MPRDYDDGPLSPEEIEAQAQDDFYADLDARGYFDPDNPVWVLDLGNAVIAA